MLIELKIREIDYAITEQTIREFGQIIPSDTESQLIMQVRSEKGTNVITFTNVDAVGKGLYRINSDSTVIQIDCVDLEDIAKWIRIFPFLRRSALVSIMAGDRLYRTMTAWFRSHAYTKGMTGLTDDCNQKDFPPWVNVQLGKKLDNLVTEYRSKVNDLVDLYCGEQEIVDIDPDLDEW